MRTWIVVGIAIVAGIIGVVITAAVLSGHQSTPSPSLTPTAAPLTSEELAYLNALRQSGGVRTDLNSLPAEYLVSQGHQICSDLDSGIGPPHEMRTIQQTTGRSATAVDIEIMGAIKYLCPDVRSHLNYNDN
jgi:hypothetical protein